MSGVEIRIALPSYRRPNRVETLSYLPSAFVYVGAEEEAAYRENYPEASIVAMPEGVQGNISRVRNWMMDHAFSEGIGALCVVDDDLQHIACYTENEKRILRTEEEVLRFIAKYTSLALDFGVYLWGINVNPDKQCYREATPFCLSSYIGSPFMVHLSGTAIRFDERLPLKEDYDFTLQHLNRYRKALRVNRYHYQTRQAEQAGGCATYRNIKREKEQFRLLQKKWGVDIVKMDRGQHNHRKVSSKDKHWDLNPVLSIPIKGI